MSKKKFNPDNLVYVWPKFKDGVRRMVHKDNLDKAKPQLAKGEYKKAKK